MSTWAPKVLLTSSISTALCVAAALGNQPAYNIPLALFGLVVPNMNSAYLASALFVLLPFTLLLDIVWCAVWAPFFTGGAELFGLILTCVNMFLKMLWGYQCFEQMNEVGGSPLLVFRPDTVSTMDHEPVM